MSKKTDVPGRYYHIDNSIIVLCSFMNFVSLQKCIEHNVLYATDSFIIFTVPIVSQEFTLLDYIRRNSRFPRIKFLSVEYGVGITYHIW